MATRASRHRGGVFVLILLCLGTGLAATPAATAGEADTAAEEPEEPELEGEAKKEHERQVKALVKYLKKEKNQELVRAKLDELGITATRVGRDALMEYAKRNKNHEFTQHAFRSLSKIGGKKAIEFLCSKDALQSRDFLVQHAAAEALGQAKDPRARGPLLDVLGNRRTKSKVISACAIALAQCASDDELTIEALLVYSHHKKDTIRAYTIEALGYLESDQALARLKEALFEDKNTRVREYAARGLGHTKQEIALPYLQEAMEKEKAFTVRQACMNAIRSIRGG